MISKFTKNTTIKLFGISIFFSAVAIIASYFLFSDSKINISYISAIYGIFMFLFGLMMISLVSNELKFSKEQVKDIVDSNIFMMSSLGRAIARKDSDSGIHNYRVALMTTHLGEKIGMRREDMQMLILGSFLHDIGKIGITDEILLKPGKLTPEEFAIIKKHVEYGEKMIMGQGWLSGAHKIVSEHHEHWDGSGYPKGLSEKEISIQARIFAVIDVFDSLCSKRPYHEEYSFEDAIKILKNESGESFDPQVVKLFLKEADFLYKNLYNKSEIEIENMLKEKINYHFGH